MKIRNLNLVEESAHILRFPKENILEQPIAQVNRSLEVKREFFLHNLEKDNVLIYFLDHTGLKKIKTQNFTITRKAIIVKQSVIPLSNIVAVA